mmetsp:Transcript_137618/g.325982  ORF Transcript_137618/g.325982 Transcript_137618/m.325982 type:complete len:212 (-) Transcript_137618:1052-1687(-)
MAATLGRIHREADLGGDLVGQHIEGHRDQRAQRVLHGHLQLRRHQSPQLLVQEECRVQQPPKGSTAQLQRVHQILEGLLALSSVRSARQLRHRLSHPLPELEDEAFERAQLADKSFHRRIWLGVACCSLRPEVHLRLPELLGEVAPKLRRPLGHRLLANFGKAQLIRKKQLKTRLQSRHPRESEPAVPDLHQQLPLLQGRQAPPPELQLRL